MKVRVGFVVPIFLAAFVSNAAGPAAAQQPAKMDPSVISRVAAALVGHRVADPPPTTRGSSLAQMYWSNVQNAPVAVVEGGTGSATVIIVHPNKQAYVLTNNHVAQSAFSVKGYPPQVFLLFYDAALKNEIFDHDRFLGCLTSSRDQTVWCQAVRNSSRLATVVATDPPRDLALLSVEAVPGGVGGIPAADMQTLQPGDEVAIIGSPKSLLWSFTTGIISAVRTNFKLGSGSGTMIQTQAPVNPGNSGGPLFTASGKLAGVVFAGRVGETLQIGKEQISVPAEGLNYAIGIDQVLAFTRSHLVER
jgi:S1-C subfamily serine protease